MCCCSPHILIRTSARKLKSDSDKAPVVIDEFDCKAMQGHGLVKVRQPAPEDRHPLRLLPPRLSRACAQCPRLTASPDAAQNRRSDTVTASGQGAHPLHYFGISGRV